mmetsp:Transcript_29584/g.78289  ORF Transcript_29584/g.78289 Transcript_29584/m.78289 type:complete len:654 (-) Transcript_29584:19-1980(-)
MKFNPTNFCGTCLFVFTFASLAAGVSLGTSEQQLLKTFRADAVEGLSSVAPLFAVSPDTKWREADPQKGVTVLVDRAKGQLRMSPGIDANLGVAWGFLADKLATTGWMELRVSGADSSRVSNGMRMYGAGVLEGALTATRMSQFVTNTYDLLLKDEASEHAMENVRRLFQEEFVYVRRETKFRSMDEPGNAYWRQIRYILMQMVGIRDGYNMVAAAEGTRPLTMMDIFIINNHAELPELMQAYTPEAVKERIHFQGRLLQLFERKAATRSFNDFLHKHGDRATESNPAQEQNETVQEWADRDWENRLAKYGHCSAFVHLSEENDDLYVGHTTWSDYSKMNRIYKYYDFKLPGASTAASTIGFSSYPGCVSSTDDFYMLNSGLVVMDTSLEILNPRQYWRVAEFPANPHAPNFMHIMATNRMAGTGTQWAALIMSQNSGTGNAQWMVVDYNKFRHKETLPAGTFWVVEQIPALVQKQDMSSWLQEKGYWASYNRPYFPEIRKRSGHTDAEQTYGSLYSITASPRAKIFKHFAPSVRNLFGMRTLMNRDAFPADGVTFLGPGHAVSARMDLDPKTPIPNGGIDAKVVNRCLFRYLQCQAISGPSHEGGSPFSWKRNGEDTFPGWPHLGLPDLWNFDWVQMTPSGAIGRVHDVLTC